MTCRLCIPLLLGLLSFGCAQVPKESVELSATVGRDIATVQKAHSQLAHILFERMRQDINQFVDGVYAPYQIRYQMDEDKKLASSQREEDRKVSILLTINAAFQPDAPAEQQEKVLKRMSEFVRQIRDSIESKRKEILDPLDVQEKEVTGSIDRAYQQIHYANSIVTGHLASVVKVHETQAELLRAIGSERDLRKEVGENLANASREIGNLVETANMGKDNLSAAEQKAQELKEAVEKLGTGLKSKPNGG